MLFLHSIASTRPSTHHPSTHTLPIRSPPELSETEQAALFTKLRAALLLPPPFAGAAADPAAPDAAAAAAAAVARAALFNVSADDVARGGAARAGRPLTSITGVLSSHLGVVRPLNDINQPNEEGQTQGELIQLLSYLESPALKVGIDVIRGGVVGHISSKNMPPEFRGKSLINAYDCGRMLQQSYYGCDDGSCWFKQPWRWNPGGWSFLYFFSQIKPACLLLSDQRLRQKR